MSFIYSQSHIVLKTPSGGDNQGGPNGIHNDTHFRDPNEHAINPITVRQQLNTANGWGEYYKRQLHQQRTAHADEIRRLKQAHKQDVNDLIQKHQFQRQQQIETIETNYQKKIQALKKTILDLQMQLKLYQDTAGGKGKRETLNKDALNKPKDKPKKPKSRSQNPHPGRNPHLELPVISVDHEILEEQRCCPQCRLPYKDTGMAEESDEVEYQVILRRKGHRRKTYKRACQCSQQPLFKTAPTPPKAMAKSQYSDCFWIEVVLHKYLYQLPLTRFINMLSDRGMNPIPTNTLTDGIARFRELFVPFENAAIDHNLQQDILKADDTRLPVFVHIEGKASFNHALWQIQSTDAIVFFYSETKEAKHIQDHLQPVTPNTTLLSDRAKVFQTLQLLNAFCWSHVRRDFVRIGKYTKANLTWAISWVKLIRDLFRLYRKRRREHQHSEAWRKADDQLRLKLAEINKKMNQQLDDPKLRIKRRKALESMKRHWHGLVRFVEDPRIPMDNNAVERVFRIIANFRKSSNGVFSTRFAHITATLLTVTSTLNLNGINVRHFMEIYLEDIARNGGDSPSEINDYLPWSMSEEIKQRLNAKRPAIDDSS